MQSVVSAARDFSNSMAVRDTVYAEWLVRKATGKRAPSLWQRKWKKTAEERKR